MPPRNAISRRGRSHGRRRQRIQHGGKTFKANRPPAAVKFKLLNVESISHKFTHPALLRKNTSWAAIKATEQYPTLKEDAEKLFRREDLDDTYSLYMLVGDDIVCAVTFVPNIVHKYKRSEIAYKAASAGAGGAGAAAAEEDSNSNSNSSNNEGQPDHISFKHELPQDMGYIDYLSCEKKLQSYRNFPHRPASHYLLYQAVKLIGNAGSRFINLLVAADASSPSTLYLFYKRMGFHCFPLNMKEYESGFPFLFTRLSYAERLAAIERLKRGETYLNEQERKAVGERNSMKKYMEECAYMVGTTEDILEKLTTTVSRSWDPPAPNVGPSAPVDGPSAP